MFLIFDFVGNEESLLCWILFRKKSLYAGYFSERNTESIINITLNLETNGAKKRKELPLKLLVMGDFAKIPKESKEDFKYERININKIILRV